MQKDNAQVSRSETETLHFFKRGNVFQNKNYCTVLYLNELPRSSRGKFQSGHEYEVTCYYGEDNNRVRIVVKSMHGKLITDTNKKEPQKPSSSSSKKQGTRKMARPGAAAACNAFAIVS